MSHTDESWAGRTRVCGYIIYIYIYIYIHIIYIHIYIYYSCPVGVTSLYRMLNLKALNKLGFVMMFQPTN